MVFTVNMLFFYEQGCLLYVECFGMDNLIGCSGSCLHPIKWHSGKFNFPKRPSTKGTQGEKWTWYP